MLKPVNKLAFSVFKLVFFLKKEKKLNDANVYYQL